MSSCRDHSKSCSKHRKEHSCDCKKCRGGKKDFTYPECHSNWEARKEKCRPQLRNKCFTYDGVYFAQRKCCPELTDWLEVFNGEDDSIF